MRNLLFCSLYRHNYTRNPSLKSIQTKNQVLFMVQHTKIPDSRTVGDTIVLKKSVFYKIERVLYPYKNALWALRPAKPLGVLSRHPCRIPKPLSPGKGLSVGLPPSPRLGLRQKQGCFGCLPKVLHDAKPTEQATLNTHFKKYIVFSTDEIPDSRTVGDTNYS